jgi:DNA-binding MarR family transcriptional regulator
MENGKGKNQASAGRLINELSRGAHMYFQHEFKEYNIGPAQVRTLFHIAYNEGQTQKQIGTYLSLDKSSITSQLQILERNGYIIRTTSKLDARMQVIGITDMTKEIIVPLQQVLSSWTETLLDGFNETERSDVFNYLDRMKNSAKNKLSQIHKTPLEK